MKNIPKKIYLQVGDDAGDDFNKLHGVTWCDEKINDSDIAFLLDEKYSKNNVNKLFKLKK